MTMARIACVTVTYGPTPTLARMLSSLRRSSPRDVEVIVVTQPSADGDASTVVQSFPWVRHIVLTENKGFGGANNLAMQSCEAEFVALLNPDLELTPGWLEPLVVAHDDRAVFASAPVLLNGDGLLDEAGQVMFNDGGSEAMGSPRWPGGRESVMFSRDVDYASAACWVLRRSRFLELGGFDGAFHPAYFEDSDLAFTAATCGWASRLVIDRPVLHHHEGASADRVALAVKARELFSRKWADRLAAQPSRTSVGADGALVRDHLCESRVLYATTMGSLDAVAREAGERALNEPRSRVTLACAAGAVLHGVRAEWARHGLEVVDCDGDTLLSRRPGWATEVIRR